MPVNHAGNVDGVLARLFLVLKDAKSALKRAKAALSEWKTFGSEDDEAGNGNFADMKGMVEKLGGIYLA